MSEVGKETSADSIAEVLNVSLFGQPGLAVTARNLAAAEHWLGAVDESG